MRKAIIPQNLPRKLKKAIYGTKGRRKHLAISIIENKASIKIVRNITQSYNNVNLTSCLTNYLPSNTDEKFTWKIQSRKNISND